MLSIRVSKGKKDFPGEREGGEVRDEKKKVDP